MEEIKGYVEHIVYRNEDNGYTVFHLNNSDGEVTCVGNFHFIEEGELLRLTGGYTTHKMYGLQFAVEESEVCEPEDLISIERYLGSGAIKGIGAALAGKIVKKFKENTFRIIEEEPERLAEIKGAVWIRCIQGFGHLNDNIPELAMSIYPQYRNKGIGTSLLKNFLTFFTEKKLYSNITIRTKE